MEFSRISNIAAKHITNLKGWRTGRKIIVIESDDWGSIRMPSRKVYKECLQAGYPVDKIAYDRYDSLAGERDLELLFGLLTGYRDKNGNHPVITANCAVANPDFDRIERANFEHYYYEPITETFARYPEHSNCFNLWQQGMQSNVFYPQYHAREHLNVSLFMDALRKGETDALFGFYHRMPGCVSRRSEKLANYYIDALYYTDPKDKAKKLAIYLDGLDLFEKLFGYRSETIIPPNYAWSPDFNRAVNAKGVRVFQTNRKLREPMPGSADKFHSVYMGMTNDLGQIYLVRNCLFEPSQYAQRISDPLERCLSDMAVAFRMRKPAIIVSHRLNYVGFIDHSNRDRTLKLLDEILKNAQARWPDIEFMNSAQLGRLISGNQNP